VKVRVYRAPREAAVIVATVPRFYVLFGYFECWLLNFILLDSLPLVDVIIVSGITYELWTISYEQGLDREAQPNYTTYKKATWRLDRNLQNYYRKRKRRLVRKLIFQRLRYKGTLLKACYQKKPIRIKTSFLQPENCIKLEQSTGSRHCKFLQEPTRRGMGHLKFNELLSPSSASTTK